MMHRSDISRYDMISRATRNTSRRILFPISYLLFLLLFLAGCIPDPTAPSTGAPPVATTGVIVVNEGSWRQDNAALTLYDPAKGSAVTDYFALKNPGLRLGDVANSILSWKGRGYISVSTSRTIEVIDIATGASLGRVRLPAGNEPRQVAIVDSVTAYAACFGDSVVRFNPTTLAAGETIAVGPAPEWIAYVEGWVLVANSGYGFLRQNEPKAGTISVLDPRSGAEKRLLSIGPNPRYIRYHAARRRLYILYGLADSTGGVVELDPTTLKELRRWEIRGAHDLSLDEQRGIGYVIGSDGVMRIDFTLPNAQPTLFVPASAWPKSTFYSLGVAPDGESIYLGTYNYFTIPGEVLIYNRAGERTGEFTAGLGPGEFVFY